MHIKIICVGKLDSRDLIQVAESYYKRIARYVAFECVEVPEVVGKFANSNEVVKRYTQAVQKKIAPDERYYVFSAAGKMQDSFAFADWVQDCLETPPNKLILAIGGSHGFEKEFVRGASGVLSFSKLTFPHQLFRVMVAEQLYRALTIMRGEKYHKGKRR